MGKDFHAAFSNMNKAVRPGVGQSAVGQPGVTQSGITQSGVAQPGVVQPVGEKDIKKVTQAEKRKSMHGVQTYLSDEEYEQLMLTKVRTKKKYEDILREALVQYMNNL
jgi:hypothetical protein